MGEYITAKSLVNGAGIYEKGRYCSRINGKHTKEYSVWKSMLLRCYSKSYQAKYPTYLGCSVSENFKNFQFFAEWCQSQVGFGLKDYHLDKDILSGSSSKVYSEETCAFIPLRLNLVLQTKPSLNKELPLGVVFVRVLRSIYPDVHLIVSVDRWGILIRPKTLRQHTKKQNKST